MWLQLPSLLHFVQRVQELRGRSWDSIKYASKWLSRWARMKRETLVRRYRSAIEILSKLYVLQRRRTSEVREGFDSWNSKGLFDFVIVFSTTNTKVWGIDYRSHDWRTHCTCLQFYNSYSFFRCSSCSLRKISRSRWTITNSYNLLFRYQYKNYEIAWITQSKTVNIFKFLNWNQSKK